MDEIERNKDKKNKEKINYENSELIDLALFDKTLKQIEITLENLGEKINFDKLPYENQKKQIETIGLIEEHKIDNTHLRMEELHNFNSVPEIKKKKLFGFYSYLALTIGIIFAIYEVLNLIKERVIFNFPASEPYIEYFYEVIEILAYVVMNTVSLIKNLF